MKNISGANQHLRANPANFNLSHQIKHPTGGAEGVEEGICKSAITESKGGQLIVKLPNPRMPLDVDPMVQIEVSIVCTKMLVCT